MADICIKKNLIPKPNKGLSSLLSNNLMDGLRKLYFIKVIGQKHKYVSNGDKAYIIATSISFVLTFVNDNTAMITNDSVWPIATIKLFIAGICRAKQMLPIIFKTKVAPTMAIVIIKIPFKFGTNLQSTLKKE